MLIVLLFVAFLIAGGIYLSSYGQLYALIKENRPDWLAPKGSLNFFYEDLPRVGNPNVVAQVICVAFGKRAFELDQPEAIGCALRIRFFLPLAVLFFLGFLAGVLRIGG